MSHLPAKYPYVELSDVYVRRFWAAVSKTDDCWLWTGLLNPREYGVFPTYKDGRSRNHPAHRISFMLAHGPIPDGLWVLHKCDVCRCVRPDHLFLGTASDNTADMMRKRRWGSQKLRALNDEQVRLVRATFQPGVKGSGTQLAKELGVTKHIIYRAFYQEQGCYR